MTRTIVVGDVHGCLEELDELLAKLSFRRGADRLVLAGDLVDRGPDPAGVVRRARELGAEGVLGNHDEKHLRWAKHQERVRVTGAKNPVKLSDEAKRQHEELTPEDLEYLRGLPNFLRLDPRWIVVHAGCVPGVPLEEQHPRFLLRIRRVDAKDAFVGMAEDLSFPPGVVPWATRWRGPESVIYGHEVHGLEEPRIDEPVPGVRCFGIDTGCCFGGRLTALVLPEAEVVQVPAKRQYCRLTVAE